MRARWVGVKGSGLGGRDDLLRGVGEAVGAGIELVIAITEGIPVMDMARGLPGVQASKSRLIGPTCPGVITPGECKIGIMPGYIHTPGQLGPMSRLFEACTTGSTRAMSITGMPSVIAITSSMPAPTASR
ncbi:MAG: hypothetical protein ACKOSQ_03345, partial [Planctomycetaceae bacterium]